MKRTLLFTAITTCFNGFQSIAQTVRMPVAVFYPAVTVYSSQQKDCFSFRDNSASLAELETFSAGVFSERRFLLKELSTCSFAAVVPTPSGSFGFAGDYFGSGLYNETLLSLSYGRKLGGRVAAGVGFHYTALKAAGYGSASTISFDAGAVFHLTDAVRTGLSVYNPAAVKFGKSGDEKLPSLYSFGIGYDASPQLFVGAEAQKLEDQPVSINAGLQYLFAEKLTARCGISSATAVYYLGFGVKVQRFRIDATASFHPYLGVTPGLLLLYSAK